MRFLAPTGIGDVTWALTKAQAIAERLGDRVVDMHLNCHEMSAIETRALEYVQRFPFVNSCRMIECGPVLKPGKVTDADGYYNYLDDGPGGPEGLFCLMPNRALEHGHRLETWFPQDRTDWAITRSWQSTSEETSFASDVRQTLGPFGIVYFGPESGNTTEGHNRGGLWSAADWAALMPQLKLPLVAIGASYDVSYYRRYILPIAPCACYNLLGQTSIGQAIALIRQSAFGIYYQCGLGVLSAFEQRPTCMFWRPEGNSIHPARHIRISGEMKNAWVPPSELDSGRYFPAVYGQTTADEIATWARKSCS